MPCKISFFYHDQLSGFSESWIDNAASPTDLPIARILTYLNTRMGVSGTQTIWDYVRVSSTIAANARKVKIYIPSDPIFNQTPKNGQYNFHGNPTDSDFGGTRFLVRKVAADLSFARVFFAGFPDLTVATGGLYVPPPTFADDFSLWVANVKANNWGWFSRTVNAVNSPAALTNITNNNDGTLVLTVNPLSPIFAPFAQFQSVVIRVRGQGIPKNINGQLTVKKLTDNTCQTVHPIAIQQFVLGTGQVILKTNAFAQVDTMFVERVTKRGPGRPFGLYRGRRAAIVRG